MELKRNIAWVRRSQPVVRPDGVFGHSVTMNPCPIVDGDTVYLFYAADDATGRRTVRLATASVSEPEKFTFRGVVVHNSDTPGTFDYQWVVLPHVVKLPDGTFYMLYSGNCGFGVGLAAFPGLGAAWSKDLLHWEKYEHNPVLAPADEPGHPLVGIAGGGLYCEDTGGGTYMLHLFYTGCPTNGDNVFLDQQKFCCYATSTDGIHWQRHGAVHKRTTARDYENIASTGGPALRTGDGLWQHWYSAIGTRWGVYAIAYAESEDGVHWNCGERYGENLALAPAVRDIGELAFPMHEDRWQDQSVSYPGVIRLGGELRMYYCGNDYGGGGIGTAVAAPMRLALTGETGGGAKLWHRRTGKRYNMRLSACVSADHCVLEPGVHQEGITHNASVFYEEFPEKDGVPLFSLRTVLVHTEEGIRFDLFAESRTDAVCRDICVTVETGNAPVVLTAADAAVTACPGGFTVCLGDLGAGDTVCVHTRIAEAF